MMRIPKVLIQLMIGLAVLLWLLQLADATKVLTSISTVDPLYLAAATVAFIAASTMIALALFVSLKRIGAKTRISDAILASFSGQLLSDVTPARSGYFLTSFILNRMDGTPNKSGMACVVTTGAMNFFVKAALSLIALAYFVRVLPLNPTIVNALLAGISLLAAGGIGLLMLLWGKRLPRIFDNLKKLPVFGKAVGRIVDALNNLQEEAEKVNGSLGLIAFLVLLSILANSTALYFISEALGSGSPILLDFMLIVPLVSAFNFVPVTIAGLGIQETSYVVLLVLLGTPLEKAVAFTLINRLLFTATDTIGLVPLFKIGIKTAMLNHIKRGKLRNENFHEKISGGDEEISRLKPVDSKESSNKEE